MEGHGPASCRLRIESSRRASRIILYVMLPQEGVLKGGVRSRLPRIFNRPIRVTAPKWSSIGGETCVVSLLFSSWWTRGSRSRLSCRFDRALVPPSADSNRGRRRRNASQYGTAPCCTGHPRMGAFVSQENVPTDFRTDRGFGVSPRSLFDCSQRSSIRSEIACVATRGGAHIFKWE